MAERTKQQLEQDVKDLQAFIDSLRASLAKAGMLPADANNERLAKALQDLCAANADMTGFIKQVRAALLEAGLIDADMLPEKVAAELGTIIGGSISRHKAELEQRDAIIAELRASPLMAIDAATNEVKPAGFSAEAPDILESEIRTKVAAGLDRKTAIQVIRSQRAQDEAVVGRAAG